MTAVAVLSVLLTAGPDDAKLKSLADAYQANRASFVNVDCRFEVRFGKCATLEDALAGKFADDPVVNDGRWIVRDPLVRYSFARRGTASDRGPTGTARTQYTGPYVDDRYLINGSYILEAGLTPGRVSLFGPKDHDGMGIRFHAFNIDIIGPHEYSNPPRYVDGCLTGRLTGRYDGTETINGVELEVVSIGQPGLEPRVKMGFDPQRGYLLTYMHDTDPKMRRQYYSAYVIEARECSGGRWIPTRRVNVRDPGSASPYRTEVLTLIELNVDDPPPDQELEWPVPSGTEVALQNTDFPQMFVDADRQISAASLPELYGEFEKKGKELQRRREIDRFFGRVKRLLRLPWNSTTWGVVFMAIGIGAGVLMWSWRGVLVRRRTVQS